MTDHSAPNADPADSEGWFSEETATFGDRLVAAREAAGLAPEELARRLGVKIKTLSAWEADLNEPRANKLQMLAGLLNVSLIWLLSGEGEGVSGPEVDDSIPVEIDDLLLELRAVKAQMSAQAAVLARLEKRLRAAAKGLS